MESLKVVGRSPLLSRKLANRRRPLSEVEGVPLHKRPAQLDQGHATLEKPLEGRVPEGVRHFGSDAFVRDLNFIAPILLTHATILSSCSGPKIHGVPAELGVLPGCALQWTFRRFVFRSLKPWRSA